MRFRTALPLFLAAAAAACAAAPADSGRPAPSGPDAVTLRAGVPVVDTLVAADPAWGWNGRFHLYAFDARAGERYDLSLRSEDFDAHLTVGDRSSGIFNPIEQNDDSGEGLNSRIRFDVPRDGTYLVLAQALSSEATGEYTVEMARLHDPAPLTATPIALGSSAFGELVEEDALLENGAFYDLYTFDAVEGHRYEVSMSSFAFDTYVYAGTGSVHDFTELDRNDDGGSGTDSRLFLTADRSGQYLIRASSYGSEATGEYSVSVRELPPPGPVEVQRTEIGGRVAGSLDDADAATDDGTTFDDYSFTGEAGQRIAITMTSEQLDSYLEFGQMDGNEFIASRSDDDGGDFLDARLVVTLPTGGEHFVRARSWRSGSFGDYTLAIEELEPVAPPTPTAISVGATVTGELTEDDAHLDDAAFDIYTFSGSAGDRLRISMRSDEMDAMLAFGRWLAGSVDVIATDDDGGEGVDSMLEVTLPEDGEYAIRATSFWMSELGEYELTLERM